MLLTKLRSAFNQRQLYAVGGALGAGALATAWLVSAACDADLHREP